MGEGLQMWREVTDVSKSKAGQGGFLEGQGLADLGR